MCYPVLAAIELPACCVSFKMTDIVVAVCVRLVSHLESNRNASFTDA